MIYFWEQDTRLFNVAIVVPMGVLLPLEREEKRKACSTIHSRLIDNPLRRAFDFYAYSILFFFKKFISFLFYWLFIFS